MERKTLLGVLKTSQILPPKSKAHIRRLNPLIDFSVNRIKHRPQRLMAPHNTVQSTNQRSFIQNALQPKAERDMVSLAHPLQLRQKPEPLLRKRRNQKPRTGYRRYRRGNNRPYTNHGRQITQHRRPKQRAHIALKPGAAHPLQHLDCQQRMTAKLKEAVLSPYPLNPQHLTPDLSQRRLNRTNRGLVNPTAVGIPFRRRQRLALQLAIGG